MKKHISILLCVIFSATVLLTPVSSMAAEERETSCYDGVTYLMNILCNERESSENTESRYPLFFLSCLFDYGNIPAAEAMALEAEPPAAIMNDAAAEILDLVNEARAAEGLQPLSADPALIRGAEIRAKEISDVFSHTRPNGMSCFTALAEADAVYRKAGENIAIGQTTAEQVVEEWLASPGHRANIMDPDFSRIGIAVQRSTSTQYGGYAWTQFFAD